MTILVLIIGISILILIHELGHFLAAKWCGLLVEEFGFGFPPKIWSKKIGETVYSLNALPFGGFVRIYGEQPGEEKEGTEALRKRSFSHQPIWRRAIIIAAGVVMNFILAWVVISGLLFFGTETKTLVIAGVSPESPAAIAGMMPGDILLDFEKGEELTSFVEASKGKPTEFTIGRNGEELKIVMTPREKAPEGQGSLGISFAAAGFPKLPFPQNIWEGLKNSVLVTGQIFNGLFKLIAGIFVGGSDLKSVVGPVGIFKVANQAAEVSFASLLYLISLISLNLAVLNIFPFPALDGGRLFFLLIEKIKGSPLSPKKENLVNAVGFAILIALMVLVTVKDVIGLL